jgi:hypothetical protein
MRDHQPIVIEEFNGLWKRGDAEACPLDHFTDCNNIAFFESGFRTRDGIDIYLEVVDPLRMYTFTQETGQSVLSLDSEGNIWDSRYPATPILTVVGMTDFAYQSYAGRAYISPSDGNTGLENEFLYVYDGDGTAARKAAGAKPTDSDGALAAANSGSAGNVEAGIHIFAVVYETDTGFLTAIGPDTLPTVTAPGGESVNLTNIPVSPNSYVTKRHIIATKLIQPAFYTGDTRGYQFFFVPDGTIENNTATTLTVSFFDTELLEDASYLLDMFEEIPAFVGLTTYHNRMIGWAEFDNISVARISVAGEPEAFNQVDGLITFPLDGLPIRNCAEYRDILYVFKSAKTNAWADNGDVPSSWAMTVLDNGYGACLHGIMNVLDSHGTSADYLIIANYSGIFLFNGAFVHPELSWKIADFWTTFDRTNALNEIQCMNDTINSILYFVMPDGTMIMGDYNVELSYQKIKWTPWNFKDILIKTITLYDKDTLLLGATGE